MTYTDERAPAAKTWKRPVRTGDMVVNDLFAQAAEAEAEKVAAMATAELHASDRWNSAAYEAVVLVSGLLPTFTSRDAWEALAKGGHDPIESERHPTAMGAVMLRAARAGLIVKTGRYVETGFAASHNRPMAEWRATTTDEYRHRQEMP